MNEINTMMFIVLFGGLALFIFAMQQMGDGLEKVAGNKMKSILQMLTSNTLLAILVGALVTSIIQSSSATTVIVVGFVSAGLMTFKQAFGVIMGVNIGTTMTAWIVAIKIDDFAWVFVALGFILMFLIKKPKVRYLGQIIFAFGLLFVGLNTMGFAMEPLAKSEAFANFLLKIKDIPVLGLSTGAIFTMIVQSSSASIGVLQTLSATAVDATGTPLISLYQALPILLGSNIGTTITAIFAIMGTRKKEAKRAAVAHTIFNLLGALIFLFALKPYTNLIMWLTGFLGFSHIQDILNLTTPIASQMRLSIAISHTVFNLANTVIWLPFIWLMVKIVKILIPGEDPENQMELKFISYSVINNPSVALGLVLEELSRMVKIAAGMTREVYSLLQSKVIEEDVDDMLEKENILDYLENEIVIYLSALISQNTLTVRQSSATAGLMHVTNDAERIGDYCMNITNSAKEMSDQNVNFSEIAKDQLKEAFELVISMVEDSSQAIINSDMTLARSIMAKEIQIDNMEETLRQTHMDRLNEGLCDPQATVIFLEIIHTIERISDHCNNIAEYILSRDNYRVHR